MNCTATSGEKVFLYTKTRANQGEGMPWTFSLFLLLRKIPGREQLLVAYLEGGEIQVTDRRPKIVLN